VITTTRLLLPLLALIVTSAEATAAIRPSFHLDSCSWRATHIVVVTEGATIDGNVEVLESWAGDLRPGDKLTIPELAAFVPEKARAIAPAFGGKKADQPTHVTGSRMVLFLVLADEPGKPKWRAADPVWKAIGVSMVWIEGGMGYALEQRINPGPSELVAQDMTERELKRTRHLGAGLRAGAEHESVGRGDSVRLAADVRTLLTDDSDFIRSSVITALGDAGAIALPSLRRVVADETLLRHHGTALRALAKAGGSETTEDMVAVLKVELKLWKETGPVLKAGWWNGTGLEWDEVERLRAHYGRIMAALDGLRVLKAAAGREPVTATRNLWRSLPQLRDIGGDQIGEACDAALKAFK